MRIYQKLIIVFLALGLLFGFAGYMLLSKAQKTLQEQIGKEALLLADQILIEIDDEIYHRIEGMRAYASDTSLVKEASLSNEEFDKIADVQNYIKTIDRDWKGKKNTPFISGILNNKLSQKLKKHLEFYKQIYGYDVFGEMYVTNKYGVAIASTVRLSDYLQADDEWYPKAISGKDFWVDDLEYDASSNALSIGVVINLYDEDGEFAGIFKGALNVEDIKYTMDLLHSRSQYKSMKPYLVDRNGITIFSGIDQRLKRKGRDIRLAEFGTDISLRKPVAQVIKGNKGYILSTAEGKELLSVFSHSNGFRDFKGLGWSIVIDFETDEVFSPVLKLRKSLGLAFLFTMIIAALVSIYIFRERMRADKALLENEEKYRSLVERANDGVAIIQDRIVIFSNSRFAEMIGYTVEEIAGVNFLEYVFPEERPQILDRYNRRMRGESVPNIYELSLLHKDGRRVNTEVNNGFINYQGKPAIFSFIRDITDRKQREEKLRKSMQKLALHLEQTPLGVIEWDLNFEVKEWNPASEKIFGFKQEEALGRHASFIVPESTREHVDGVWNGLLNNRGGTRSSNENVTKDGRTIFCEWYNTPLIDTRNRVIGAASLVMDITERKQAEEALQESERKYRTLFERSADAVLIIEGDNFVDCNPATVKMLGYKNKKELLNTHPSQLSPPLQPDGQDSFEKANQMMAMAFDQGSNRFEWDHQRKNGEVFPVEVLLTSIPFKEGNFLHVVWRDITERKQAEKELENYRKHLEKLVKERTRELEKVQEELVRKERLATLGQLTATVSHEIRNPLGTIRNAVFSIGDAIGHNEIDRAHRSLKLAERNIKRCDRIINELLDFTRSWKAKPEQTDIDNWIDEVLDEQAFTENIECVRNLHSGIALPIDREYIRRAINNVVANADQALHNKNTGENRLTVESIATSERLELRFTDTGHGIPEAIMGKIYEPLFSTRSFGIGLGIPIIKNIMEEHSGGVELQSKEGKGTTVTLWLPIPKLEEKG